MKLIYLELEEEITSVIDKVGKISDNSITLVVPKGANLIQSIVNLKLLRKHAEMEGKEITVVTSDQVGVNLAKRAGLAAQQRVQHGDEEGDEPEPVPKSRITSYKEIEKAGVGIKKPVKTSPPAKKKGKAKSVSLLPKQKLLITIIVILVILVGGGAFAYFYLPKADINIVLNTETITNDVEVEILTSATELDEETNVIPGKRYEAEVSGEIEREATEEKDVGRKAQGTITVYNNYQTTPRTIVPSRFQTADGKVFRSTETVTIPGYTDTGEDKVPGTASVPVEAEEPGEEYNIGPSDFILPALSPEIQKQIYGESSSAMVGGSSKMAKVVSDDDLKAAEEELTTRLKDEAVSEYSDENLIVVPEGSKVEVLEYQPSPAKGEEAEKFKLALKLKLTFLAFDEDDMLAVAEDDIHEVLPEDKFLLGGSETSISYDLANEDIDNGKLDVFYHASKSFARSLDREVVKEEMAGLSAGEIEAELSKKDSVESVTVDFWPFWVKSAPTNTKRIFVDISLN